MFENTDVLVQQTIRMLKFDVIICLHLFNMLVILVL